MSDAHVLHFFGGKGGWARPPRGGLRAAPADEAPKEKVLLVSLDPVRSLSDLVKKKLSAKRKEGGGSRQAGARQGQGGGASLRRGVWAMGSSPLADEALPREVRAGAAEGGGEGRAT